MGDFRSKAPIFSLYNTFTYNVYLALLRYAVNFIDHLKRENQPLL